MNNQKKLIYDDSMYVGIHTVSGTSNVIATDPATSISDNSIKVCSQRKVRNKDMVETYLQINTNKHTGVQKMITRYSEFMSVLEEVLSGIGMKKDDFKINRADFCFNFSTEEHYEAYKKLHRMLLCCLSDKYSFKNAYQTQDLWTYESLSLAIKNDSYEAENYNKFLESEGSDEAKNRLEIRSKKIKSDIPHEFLEIWCDKLHKCLDHFEAVQQRYNMNLERLYKEDLEKPKKQRRYYNLTAFLLQYQDCIFTSSQMVDLLSRFDEVENPKARAKNFKSRHNIEYFSKTDLKYIVSIITKKMEEYFGQ